MKFEKLIDVPEKIRPFYHEEIRNEPVINETTGELVMVDEQYTYQDEEGTTQTAVRKVQKYLDVVYVKLIPFGEIKTDTDLLSVVKYQKGKGDHIIRSFIDMVNNGIKSKFHGDYIEYLNSIEENKKAQEYYDTEIAGGVLPEDVLISVPEVLPEPTLELIDTDTWFLENYTILRKAAYPGIADQLDILYHDRINGDASWIDAIQAVKEQYPKV